MGALVKADPAFPLSELTAKNKTREMPEPSQPPPGPLDPTDHLPLTLLKSDTVPPGPTRSASTIDWLPDFSGYSWVAYGASSLLVISHLPSPLSRQESLFAPLLRQVFELSGHHSTPVTAVSWSPVTPSVGELAAASGNCVFFFSPDSTSSIGSFCWSHNGVLVQSTEVEAMRWSGSGDGLILGGVDVVLWKRKTNRTWEIAWKFRTDVPQNLVSATWSIEGPSSSTANWGSDVGVSECNTNNANISVMVYYGCGINEYAKTELGHPLPVSMIQWRPLSGPGSRCGLLDLPRQVLLTCCLDGTVRLWSEVDNGKVGKLGKESGDRKGLRRTFCVAAVIEINQVLRGRLGVDVFLSWATDIGGVYRIGDGATHFFSAEGHWHDKVGRCEWLIGFGPGTCVSFWAVHCLDDVSPARFPRVTLWKRQELQGFEEGAAVSDSKDLLLLNKVVTSRNSLAGPPEICSLIHLLPSNSLGWSLMYNQTSSSMEDRQIESKIDVYSVTNAGGFPVGGHTGNILQVVMHPFPHEAELAASLDSSGLLLFWLVSAISNRNLGIEVLAPAWEVCGKIATHDIGTKYTSVRWAPSLLGEDFVILLGHVGGIDCFIVNTSQVGEEGIVCSYLCTVPLGNHGPFSDGPANIFAIPLPSTCNQTFLYNKFLLLGIWMRDFCALSWEITLHSGNLPGSCSECGFDGKNSTSCFVWKFENTIGNKRYSLGVNPCSSRLPELYSHDQVTCYSVVCPRNLIHAQGLGSHKVGIPAYIMATGCSDGTLKLWRSISSELSAPYIPWELVGEFAVNEGPVSALSITGSGQRIATVSTGSYADGISIIHIWDTVHLAGAGTFVSEDTLSIDGEVVALSWLALGNGENVLGVCMKNELQVYVQKHGAGHPLLNPGKSLNLPHWSCIAVASTFHAIRDFLWGTGTNAVVVHDRHFSLYGQLLLLDKKQHVKIQPNFKREDCEDEKDTDIPFSIFTGIDNELGYLEELFGVISRSNEPESPKNTRVKNECFSSSLLVAVSKLNYQSCTLLGSWNLVDITEKLTGMLPVYHPEVLLMNISTGNWKRANVAVTHLTEFLSSSNSNGSEKRHNSAKHVHFFPQIPLASYMEGLQLKNSVGRGFEWGVYTQLPSSSQFVPYNGKCDASSDGFSLSSAKSGVSSFMATLEQSNNLAACATYKLQMFAVVDLLGEVQHSSSAYGNLDEPGRRFWVALRFQQLHYCRRFGRSPSVEELVVDPQLFSWAFHSDCQDTLLSSFLPNEPSWKEMRTLGVGFWFTNGAQLRARMERLARSQYLKKKDPKDCTLLYIALNRLQVLASLFKISKDEKDKPLVGFLSRNFQEEKNKAAALKNAYVLMGRHQLELAIAFFLLGGDTSSAITICAKNLGDEQLALVICRFVESSGGPLGRHLITKFILPSASERSDYWLASLLEWELGNYSRSFVRMLGFEASSVIGKPVPSVNHVAFTDPNIGLYCLLLANKNSMKNAIGEQNAAILGGWANFMIVKSFSRCGLPLEALEFFSSSLSVVGPMSQETLADVDHLGVLNLLLKPSSNESLNWLSGNVALHLEFQAKLDLTLQYFSNLMKEHPGWLDMTLGSVQPGTYSKNCEDYEGLRATFLEKLYLGLSKIEQKFSVDTFCIVEMILVWLCSNGLPFVGYDVLLDYNARNNLQQKGHNAADFCRLHKPLLRAAGDISLLLSRFIVSCTFSWFQPKSCHLKNDQSFVVKSIKSCALYFQGIMQTLCTLRVAIREIFCDFLEDSIRRPLVLLDLFEYSAHFALYWLQQNSEGLLLMLQPLLTTCTDGKLLYEVDMAKLKNSLYRIEEMLSYHLPAGDSGIGHEITTFSPHKQEVDLMQSSSQDERWHVIGACLWHHMSSLVDHKLHGLSIELEDSWISGVSHGVVPFWRSSLTNLVLDASNLTEIELLSLILSSFLRTTLSYLSSYHMKLLVSFLYQKIEDRLHVQTLVWLKDSSVSQATVPSPDVKDIVIGGNELSTFDALWDSCADPSVISRAFEHGKIEWSHVIDHRFSKAWTDVYKDIAGEDDPEEMLNHEVNLISGPSTDEIVSPPKGFFRNGRTLLSYWQKDAVIVKEVSDFQCPNEIYKSDGDLFEVMCINSVSECQAAVASNRKGIIFFSWEDEVSFGHPSDYIWSDADWPPNGWAGFASTPIPTCVSPGVGLGSRKGSHLGLGGATIGMGSLARPRKDLMGGGAFGVPGYTGVGASGLGWEVQEDFEEFVDSPPTVENIRTRAFSSHPSRPFFLVGSSNTHIYLWEFGKDKATATYGVLPAANVPPPYALASVSAVQFDHFGHRFATAAIDGTVCTWQLEVGGRSNIRPTESSLCFNGHASDVTYVTSSGSIIATAGYSSNGANVVVWDTLAPPTTSRVSIMCHEGGARSISVLENVIGSGSVSPLIVTGGKGGDVGIHDFRYIATGRTKKHRQHNNSDVSRNSSSKNDTSVVNNNMADQNLNGMLWYIPKAHLGSVTKISAIPNTSLFLTGSKDGDVKLWDAKAAKLVHHWPKLHERRTFLQPNSRGFGGVVRAAVTDIQVVSRGFLTCGGDGTVKLVQLKGYQHGT